MVCWGLGKIPKKDVFGTISFSSLKKVKVFVDKRVNVLLELVHSLNELIMREEEAYPWGKLMNGIGIWSPSLRPFGWKGA